MNCGANASEAQARSTFPVVSCEEHAHTTKFAQRTRLVT